jgi:hypothetical protein
MIPGLGLAPISKPKHELDHREHETRSTFGVAKGLSKACRVMASHDLRYQAILASDERLVLVEGVLRDLRCMVSFSFVLLGFCL